LRKNFLLPKKMIRTIRIALILFTPLFILSSCTTYYIPKESFREQFAGMDSSRMRRVTTRGPAGDKVTYKSYPIDFIHCVDSKGNPVELKNSPSIEIRFTDSANYRITFYFDLITVNDTAVSGIRSRFITSFRKTIPLNTIRKIEVQDGHKNFHYTD
jgi:hypothetical protein